MRILDRAYRIIRGQCNLYGSPYPIIVVQGHEPPTRKGRSYYWTTPGGREIRHPNSYHYPKKYNPSTLRIEVGINWILVHSDFLEENSKLLDSKALRHLVSTFTGKRDSKQCSPSTTESTS